MAPYDIISKETRDYILRDGNVFYECYSNRAREIYTTRYTIVVEYENGYGITVKHETGYSNVGDVFKMAVCKFWEPYHYNAIKITGTSYDDKIKSSNSGYFKGNEADIRKLSDEIKAMN